MLLCPSCPILTHLVWWNPVTAGNVFALIAQPQEDATGSALHQILALVRRSDSIAVKSEGTRVLVNVIKSLWSSEATADDSARAQRRRECMAAVAKADCATALARLVGRSKKYPILINEGVVALSLLSTHTNGGASFACASLVGLLAERARGSRHAGPRLYPESSPERGHQAWGAVAARVCHPDRGFSDSGAAHGTGHAALCPAEP